MHALTLADRIHLAARLLTRLLDRDLEPLGIYCGQARLLRETAALDGPTAADLRARTRLDRATISVNLRKLERIGLVASRPDPRDRRSRRYGPTASGRATLNELATLAAAHEAVIAADLDEDATRRTLGAVAANLSYELRHPGRRCAIFGDDARQPRIPSEGPPP